MGVGPQLIEHLSGLRKGGYLPIPSAVIEIGAQQMSNALLNTPANVKALGNLFGAKDNLVMPSAIPTHIVHGNLEHLNANAPSARLLYEWLGFRYACIDIDGSPGSIPLDLNYDQVPRSEKGKYQLVTNFGTTEHIANQLNAFKVIHDLTIPGGVMIHEVPAQGMFNHGLINYNPKFFWMLARSNEYKFLDMDFGGDDSPGDFPQNAVDMIAEFRPDIRTRRAKYLATDAYLLVVLQKRDDEEFVAPIDVPTGTTTDNRTLIERYWRVFNARSFSRLIRRAITRTD